MIIPTMVRLYTYFRNIERFKSMFHLADPLHITSISVNVDKHGIQFPMLVDVYRNAHTSVIEMVLLHLSSTTLALPTIDDYPEMR